MASNNTLQLNGLLAAFEKVTDDQVSPRFRYGEIRLSRLNAWSKFLLGRSQYYRIHEKYDDRIARAYGPLLFIFALCAVILADLQVALAVPEAMKNANTAWRAIGQAARGFSTATLILVAIILLYAVNLFILPICSEVIFTLVLIVKGRIKLRHLLD